jgi:outer membrane protein TolC
METSRHRVRTRGRGDTTPGPARLARAWPAIALIGFATPVVGAPDSLSVTDCVRLARQHAPALAAARHDESAAAADSAAVARNTDPDVFLSAGATVAPDWSYDPALTNLGEYHLQTGVAWTLADGGHRSRERARAGVESALARERRRLAGRDSGQRAAELGYELLRIDETAAVLEEDARGMQRLSALVIAGLRSGGRSPADSMRLGLALADTRLQLEDLRTERRAAAAELRELIGRAGGDGPVLATPPAGLEAGPTEADSLALLDSIERMPELALARAEEAAARIDSADARHRSPLELKLALDAGLWGSDLTRAVPASLLVDDPDATFSDRLRRDLGASAAIDLRWPLVDRARAPALGARIEGLRGAESRHDAEIARQRREALDELDRWRAAADRVRTVTTIAASASAHTLHLKSLYAAGATTMFELLDAVQLERDSRVRLADARMDARLERFRIEDRR